MTFLFALLAALRAFTPEELLQTRRIDDPQVSPGGRRVAFTVRQKHLEDNRDHRDVWIATLPAGAPQQFTRDGKSDHARWSPDGNKLLVVSDRGPGEAQLYLYEVDGGGDPRRLTSLPNGVGDAIWSPDGQLIAFTSEVHPACKGETAEVLACTKAKADERTKSKLRAHLTDRLFYRHWNEWRETKRTHVFVISAGGGAPRDLTPGDADWPTWRLGGGDDFAFTPDGRELIVSHKPAQGEAWRTNSDLYAIPTAGGPPRNLTADNPGDDAGPRVSPDGRFIAWRAQARDGYEADKWRLKLLERATGRVALLADFADGAGRFAWKPDGTALVAEVMRNARHELHVVPIDGSAARPFAPGPGGHDFALAPDGAALAVASGINRPPELVRIAPGGAAQRLTSFNAEQFAGLDLGPAPEEQWVAAGDGARVHSWILKPPGLAGRAPLVVLIHGGPQGAWEDTWGMRWNAAAYAARGYIVLLPNPRGSTGFGHAFTEAVTRDWGGLAFDDIMRSVDAVEKRPDVEPGRACAAGASYGGYMVNWIAGHSTRFKCLVSHAGVFDLVSMYGSTEELWFPEWDLGGPYWDNPDGYRKWSPSSYVKAFATPTLVTMGEQDYRIGTEQPFGMFTALQRRGVPSKLLDFPDEGHWINKPRNSLFWYRTVLDWIDEHLKKPGGERAEQR